jgi:hypothetical protein
MIRGDLSSLKKFAQTLRQIPRVVAQKVTTAAAPAISSDARSTFAAGQDPYGVPWAPGEHGQKVTLVKTGLMASALRYVAIGTKLRVAMTVAYAKYQLGKRPVFPRQGAPLPASYAHTLADTTSEVIREEIRRAA